MHLNKNRRRALIQQALAATLIIASGGCFAQPYPSKPVKLVVGFAAGGPTDVVARAFADHASRSLSQPFVVENKPGANTILAAQAVASAPADGYTLLFGATNHTMIPALYGERVKFDPVKSFQPICSVATSPTVLVVGPSMSVSTLGDFLGKVRAEPGRVSAGSPGVGSSGHFATEMFARANGLRFNHVPYKGAAPAVNDLMGGQLDSSFATLGSVLPQIEGGKLTALAVAAPRRTALLPKIPTFAETGAGDFSADAWYGVLAPAGVSTQVVEALQRVSIAFVKSQASADKLRTLGLEASSLCGAPFAEQVARETSTYSRIAMELNLKAD